MTQCIVCIKIIMSITECAKSRLIIKNLPKDVKADNLKQLFSRFGTVTDIKLQYNSRGTFRKLAFVGYMHEEEVANAQRYFDNTFIDTSKITVEVSLPPNDSCPFLSRSSGNRDDKGAR